MTQSCKMRKILCLKFFGLIIGSFADDDSPPIIDNTCEITGFSVFHKKPRQSTLLQSVFSPLDDLNTSRLILRDYPLGRINIQTNVNSSPGCELPRCVKTKLEPNFYRLKDLTAISYENDEPYTLYSDVNKPQKQASAFHYLSAEAYQTSDCSGTPYSSLTQGVQIVLNKTRTYTFPPTIVVYDSTSSPVTDADTMVFGTATCNFLRDALGNGFLFERAFEIEGVSDTSVKAFDCDFSSFGSETGGPLQIEYQIALTLEIARDINPNPLLSRLLPAFYEPWTAIMNYFLDVPTRTVGTTEEVMSTRVKSEIASNSPYQQYTNALLTVEPYTQVFKPDLVVSYIGTGGVPVTVRNRAVLVNTTCAFLIKNLPLAFNAEGVALTVTKCRLKSHASNGTPLIITYNIEAKLVVGPTLSPEIDYIESFDGPRFLASIILYMFEDRYDLIADFVGPQMSTVVKNAVGPKSPYYKYQDITFKSILTY